jgi:hypothetical protein
MERSDAKRETYLHDEKVALDVAGREDEVCRAFGQRGKIGWQLTHISTRPALSAAPIP